MKLADFQKDKKLVKSARDLLNGEVMRHMLSVTEDESPLHVAPAPHVAAEHAAAYRLGFIEGYYHFQKVLMATGTLPRPLPVPLEPTYEPPHRD